MSLCPSRLGLFRAASNRIITRAEGSVHKISTTIRSIHGHSHHHCSSYIDSRLYHPRISLSRLLGTKAGIPGNPPGEIIIESVQDVLPKIDIERLRSTVYQIRDLMGYPTYDVTLYLVEDQLMQETNRDTRGMDQPTDILSFQFHRHTKAGVLQDPEFDIPDFYTLGEMLIDVPYVMRRCQEDQDWTNNNSADSTEDEYDDEEDRGVSGAMATIYDPEERINMLLVHGMLHLVGHDHEEDDEFELMVSKEEEILGKLGMLPSNKD